MAKEILFGRSAIDKLESGIRKLAAAVKITLGPNGRNVIIARDNQVAITKDGATVANEVELDDYLENVGSQLIKQIARKTALETGDGTTTATILAEAIFINGLNRIRTNPKLNISSFQRGMEKQVKIIVKELKNKSIPVLDSNVLMHVATISANNDTEIGELLAEAFKEIGFNGVITMDASKTSETFIEIVDGMEIKSGYASPFFANGEASTVEMIKPLIFLYEGKINTTQDILPILDYSSINKKSILIVCDGIEADPLNTILINKMKGLIDPCIIRTPGSGEAKSHLLDDLAALLDTTVISPRNNSENIKLLTKDKEKFPMYIGGCERVRISAKTTSFIDGFGTKSDRIRNRLEEINTAINDPNTSESARLLLQERSAKLTGGVAVLRVGANSEVELKEKVDRIEDALGATRAAIEEGIIPGGGLALYDISLISELYGNFENHSEISGAQCILEACVAPFRTIIENSDENFDLIRYKLTLHRDDPNRKNHGYNAKTNMFENLIETGIIDPVKVTRCALENALSIASLILKTDCLMVKKP